MSTQMLVRVDEADAGPQRLNQITLALAFTVSRSRLGSAPAGARSAELMVGGNRLKLTSASKEDHGQLIGEFVQALCRT
jgi:hypothetical protein